MRYGRRPVLKRSVTAPTARIDRDDRVVIQVRRVNHSPIRRYRDIADEILVASACPPARQSISRAGFNSPAARKRELENRRLRSAADINLRPIRRKRQPQPARPPPARARLHAANRRVSTLIDGGLYPPFNTSRNFPSFDNRRRHRQRVQRHLRARRLQSPPVRQQKASIRLPAHALLP